MLQKGTDIFSGIQVSDGHASDMLLIHVPATLVDVVYVISKLFRSMLPWIVTSATAVDSKGRGGVRKNCNEHGGDYGMHFKDKAVDKSDIDREQDNYTGAKCVRQRPG